MIFKRNVENLIFHIMLIAMFATPYATLYIADGEDYWAGILAIISFFALLLLHLLDRNKQIIITTTDVALVLCSIYIVINSQHPVDLRHLTRLLTLIGIWVLFRQNRFRGFYKHVTWYVLIFTSAQAIIAIIQYLGFLSSFHDYFLVTGVFANPAPLGGYLSIGFVVLICNVLCLSKTQKWEAFIYLLIGIILFTALMLADSRAAWMGISVSLCILYNTKYNRKNNKYIILCLFVLVLTILFALHTYRPASSNTRIQIWTVSMNLVKESPLTGHGTGSFTSTYMKEQSKIMSNTNEELRTKADNVKVPYNETIKILCEQGIIGLLLMTTFLGLLIRNLWRSFKRNRNIFFIFPVISILIYAQFSYPFSVLSISLIFFTIASIAQNSSAIISFNSNNVIVKLLLILALIISIFDLKLRIHIYNKLEGYLKLEKPALSISEQSITGSYIRHEPHILIYNAKAQMMVGDDEEAINSFLQLLKYDIDTSWYISLGDLYEKKGLPEIAESYYLTAHRMCPGLIEPIFARFQLWQNRNKQKALQLAFEIRDTQPKIENKKTNTMKKAAIKYIDEYIYND